MVGEMGKKIFITCAKVKNDVGYVGDVENPWGFSTNSVSFHIAVRIYFI